MQLQWNLKSKFEQSLFHSPVCYKASLLCPTSHPCTHNFLKFYILLSLPHQLPKLWRVHPGNAACISKAYITKSSFWNTCSLREHQGFMQILGFPKQLHICNYFRFPAFLTLGKSDFLSSLQSNRAEVMFFKCSLLKNIILLSTSRNWLHFKSVRF